MATLILLILISMIEIVVANPIRRAHYHTIDGIVYSSGYGNHLLPQPLEPKQHEPITVDKELYNPTQICKKMMIQSIYPHIYLKANTDEFYATGEYYSINKLFKKSSELQIVQIETVLDSYSKEDVFKMMNLDDFNNFDDFVQFYFKDCVETCNKH